MTVTTEEETILNSIVVQSENDPLNPEFPPENPKFPATPTYKIQVPGFSNVWVKDESKNTTGTHKDRMAWEIVVTYRNFLLEKKKSKTIKKLPHMSIISSGSAAIAIQTVLQRYKLPKLKVLVDKGIDVTILKKIKELGCEVYKADLQKKALLSKDILRITKNEQGFDITSAEALDPATRYYDWLSYEILNENPDYCFIPFGTGNLYENILNVNKKEIYAQTHDPRFKGDIEILRDCNFMGATTNNPKTKAVKLYSSHLPFVHYDEQWIRLYKEAGFCGPESNVFTVQEEYIEQALEIVKKQNITTEASGIAGLALLLQMQKKIPKDKKILIINTGKTKL